MRWGPLAVSMMVDAIANSMVGGMVGSHKVAMTVEGLCVTFSITMHSQALVVVALKALGAPVGVTNPCGVHPKGGVEVAMGQGEEKEEENCHGGSQAQS